MSNASAPDLESFLARIYVDTSARAAFVKDPRAAAQEAGLCEQDVHALLELDHDDLLLAARSFAHKRRKYRPDTWFQRVRVQMLRQLRRLPTRGPAS